MLKVRQIVDILEAEILVGEENLDMEIYSGCGADLMSDVMAFVKESVLEETFFSRKLLDNMTAAYDSVIDIYSMMEEAL